MLIRDSWTVIWRGVTTVSPLWAREPSAAKIKTNKAAGAAVEAVAALRNNCGIGHNEADLSPMRL
ncbi:hypothetical protein [Streptomyces sp. NPDC006463]|uniref:hypothetical protein n=1 Tax=Streptomyces sp. NPDC006463 TaxID=3364746 RepID=UPI0036785FDA